MINNSWPCPTSRAHLAAAACRSGAALPPVALPLRRSSEGCNRPKLTCIEQPGDYHGAMVAPVGVWVPPPALPSSATVRQVTITPRILAHVARKPLLVLMWCSSGQLQRRQHEGSALLSSGQRRQSQLHLCSPAKHRGSAQAAGAAADRESRRWASAPTQVAGACASARAANFAEAQAAR